MFSNTVVRALVCVWLSAIAVGTVLFVVYSLSAYQVQLRIQSFNAGGQSFSVWHLKRLKVRQAQRQTYLKPAEQKLKEFEAQLESATEDQQKIISERNSSSADRSSLENEISAALRKFNPTFKVPAEVSFIRDRKDFLVNEAQKHDISEETNDKISKLESVVNAYFDLLDKEDANDEKIKKLQDQVKTSQSELDKLKSGSQSIFGSDSQLTQQQREKVEDFVSELNVLEEKFGFMRLLTEVPSELLTILLVLCTGALGSAIYLTQFYLSESQSINPSFYLFRPFFGALTALALFVVVKAGVVIAGDPRTLSQSGASLNPFFVAFLGILSGLLSEGVVDKIRESGQNWLRTSLLGKPRWALYVSDQMKQQKKTVSQLGEFFDLENSVIEDWVNERQPTPPDAQRIIAAWLGKPARQMFTDLPPDGRAKASKKNND